MWSMYVYVPVPSSQGELAEDCERLKQENAQQEIQIAELEYVRMSVMTRPLGEVKIYV